MQELPAKWIGVGVTQRSLLNIGANFFLDLCFFIDDGKDDNEN